tara:strand:+ start:629 stop:850 length:222 start_codon:yes stop_codon:yes gene_type:complete
MKWLDKFRKKPEVSKRRYYCQCGGIETRQTTLDEWDPHMFRPEKQQVIWEYIPSETTERVGMKSDKRRYRGNI